MQIFQSYVLRWLIVAFAFVGICFAGHLSVAQKTDVDPKHAEQMKAGLALFKSSVRATLQEHCLKCHNAKSKKADFDLSTRKALVESGHLGEAPADSRLLQLVRHEDEPHMQPRGAPGGATQR